MFCLSEDAYKGRLCVHAFVVDGLRFCDLLYYSLRFILLFINTDVSITKLYIDISILLKSIMSRREYCVF
jgi:hypothetical protein